MKRTILTIAIITSYVCCYSQHVIPNPASLYVKFLGYKSEVKIDGAGNQKRVCVLPDKSECDEWAFFRGTCGQKFSYCAIKGYKTESVIDTVDGAMLITCKCVDTLKGNVKIPLLEFMMMNGDTLFRDDSRDKKLIK